MDSLNLIAATGAMVSSLVLTTIAVVFGWKQAGGAVMVASCLMVMGWAGLASKSLLVAVGLLAAGGLLMQRRRFIGLAVVTAGAGLLVSTLPFFDRRLFQLACLGYLLVVGLAMLDLESRRGPLASLMMPITILGIFATVPRTDEALILLFASVSLLVLPRMRSVAAFPIAGLAVWTSVVGGAARTGSIVGGLACCGLLLIEPLSTRLDGILPKPVSPKGVSLTPRLIVTAHILVVVLASRVAGFREKSEPAFALALMAFALGWSIIALVVPAPVARWWNAISNVGHFSSSVRDRRAGSTDQSEGEMGA